MYVRGGCLAMSATVVIKRTGRKNSNNRPSFRNSGVYYRRTSEAMFGDVSLTDAERRFLATAEEGQLSELRHLCEDNGHLNINCVDYLGRSALQLAVTNEHMDVALYLLDRCKLEVIEDALMHAIRNNSARMVEAVLNHQVYSNQKYRLKLEFVHEAYDQDEDNPFFSSDLTPIIIAAHYNNFDIINLLLQKGFYIQAPHDYFCTCAECKNMNEFDPVVTSRTRLNAFRALSSSAYISLSSDDPIMTSFKLSRQLDRLANREKQYKTEYLSLSEQCKNYSVELFNLCRTHKEVVAALHGNADTADLSRIKLAIRYGQKRFIASPSCQEHLMNKWYGSLHWVRHLNVFQRLALVPVSILSLPLLALIYLLFPGFRISRFISVPLVKFINSSVSYLLFLVLLFIATNRASQGTDGQTLVFTGGYGAVNILILLYVLGMFWGECKQLWEEGWSEYFNDLWNWMDITMILLYTSSYVIQILVAYKLATNEYLLLVANMFFSLANILSFCRIVYLLPASETFGQLQISYGRMLQDVFKFIVIYFTVMMAFVCGLTSLYSRYPNDNEHFNQITQSIGSLYWATFGMGDSDAPKLTDAHERRDVLTEITGYVLYGIYLLGAVVVLINMLIAMMSNTFQEIHDEEDVEWKFARACLWMFYIQEGSTLPMPFNIIPSPKTVYKFIVWIKTKVCPCVKRNSRRNSRPAMATRDHKAIMHKVVLRYIHQVKYGRRGTTRGKEVSEAVNNFNEDMSENLKRMNENMVHMHEDIHNLRAEVEALHHTHHPLMRSRPVQHSNHYMYRDQYEGPL